MAYIGDRRIISIISFEEKFMFTCCKNFDKNLSVMCSFDSTFSLKIKRHLERSMCKVYDMVIDANSKNESGFTESLKILSSRDD